MLNINQRKPHDQVNRSYGRSFFAYREFAKLPEPSPATREFRTLAVGKKVKSY